MMKNEEEVKMIEQNLEVEKAETKTSTKQEEAKSDDYGKSLFKKAKYGRTKEISTHLIVKEKWDDLDKQDQDGNTPLHLAIRCGHRDAAFRLIEFRTNLSIKNHKGQSVIDIALIHGRLKIAKKLHVQYGLRPSANILFDMVTEAVSTYRSLYTGDKGTFQNRNEDIFECLDWLRLALKIPFNITDASGNTLLHYAVIKSDGFDNFSKPLIRKLVGYGYGLDVRIKNKQGETPCDIAVKQINFEKTQLEASQKTLTTLNRQAEPRPSTATNLFKYFKSPSKKPQEDQKTTAPFIFDSPTKTLQEIKFERKSELESLEDKIKSIKNFFDEMSEIIGMTELHILAKQGLEKEVAEYLLKHATKWNQIEAQDVNGNTALHLATYNNHKETILKLINLNARLDAKNNTGYTPIDIALIGGNLEIVKIFYHRCQTNSLKFGPDPKILFDMITEIVYPSEPLPLDAQIIKAKNSNIINCLEWLHIICKLAFDIKDDEGNTLLHYAAMKTEDFAEFSIPILKKLASIGLDINATNKDGKTPKDVALEQAKLVTQQTKDTGRARKSYSLNARTNEEAYKDEVNAIKNFFEHPNSLELTPTFTCR